VNATNQHVTSINQDPNPTTKKEPTSATAVTAAAASTAKQVREATEKRNAERTQPASVSRPTKYLPTDRITFSRQLDILRAWAAASGPTNKIVTNNEVASIVKMQPSTVSIANAFFADTRLLVRADAGYIPAAEVVNFLRAFEWNPEAAPQKLAPVIEKTWFAEVLLPKLSFGPMSEDEAIAVLGQAATAGKDYFGQLKTLVDYLAAAGLVQRDGNQVKKGSPSMATAPTVAESTPTLKPETMPDPTPQGKSFMPPLFGTTGGKVEFNIAVKLDMTEFAGWQPENIAAFFNGIAQVLAAKAKGEKAE
jgi:hypothetical protein